MRHSNHKLHGRRAVPNYLVCTIGVALLLSGAGGAVAAGAGGVVPPSGRVDGHGYGYWLQRSWQFVFSSSPSVKPCQTLTAGGQRVGYLTLATLAPGKYKFTCSEPRGRPLYIDELSAECSTFKGDHGNFGTSATQLERCARAMFKGLTNSTTIDGRPVDMTKLIAGTGTYHVQIPKNNALGAPPGTGWSAAYGYGLLLAGLETAQYIIHSRAKAGGAVFNVTWTVRVR
jgi:hypothetical protein